MSEEEKKPNHQYLEEVRNFLLTSGKEKPEQDLLPIEKFFRALSQEQLFKKFISAVDFDTTLPVDFWRFAHYYSALVYLLRTTDLGGKNRVYTNEDLFNLNLSQWEKILEGLFSKDSILLEFKRMIKTDMQGIFPQYTIPLRLVLNRLFEGKNDLIGLDLGCALHIDLPIIASNYTPSTYRLPNDEISQYNFASPIIKGIGVDLKLPDFEWIRACNSALRSKSWEEADTIDTEIRDLCKLREEKSEQFPFIQGDAFSPPIQDNMVDFVLTKRMRYQWKDKDQGKIKESIKRLLKDGGYWITVGEEEYFRDGHESYLKSGKNEIFVYQKRGNELVKITETSIIDFSVGNGAICYYDCDFFRSGHTLS